MRYFNFDRLINKYSVEITVVSESKGYYDDVGDFVRGTQTEQVTSGAVFGISDTKIYRSDGVLTAKDKQLYTKETLGDITKAYVIYNGNKYKVEQEQNAGNAYFTGVFSYVLKWISAFKDGDTVD